MLKFKRVLCKNFMSIGDKPIEIQLDANPTTLVQGKNGAAKSSIFLDSISFGLYNRAFRNINKAKLINSINKRETLVEVDFSIGSKEYQLRRGMRPDFIELWEDGVLLKQEGGRVDYQEMIEKRILRMNHKSFCQIVTIGSATFVPFMQLNPGQRREIIEDLLDLQVFSQMNRLLKNRVDKNRNAVNDIKSEIELLNEKVRLQQKYIQSLRQKATADRQDTLDRIQTSEDEIAKDLAEIEQATTRIEYLQETIADFDKVRKRKSQYDGVEGGLRERTKKLRTEVKFFNENDHCPTCKQAIDETFKCETIDAKQRKLDEVNDATLKVLEEIQNHQKRLEEIAAVQKDISKNQGEISKINSNISGLRKYISSLQKELNDENSSDGTEAEYQAKLDQYREDLQELEKRRSQLLAEKSTFDVASVLLKDGGIKAKIIKQYIPVINAAINKYLQVLDLNVQFEINENFEETIKSRFREDFVYESFSEGEKARINLAITFAWRAIAKMRNSSSTNLLILDEVADGGVDSDGIDDLVKILNTLGDTHVFVISHRESMLDKFHACIKIAKIKNFSHIVED